MTKRTFILTTTLLIVIDIAAAFWYFTMRSEKEDEHNPFSTDSVAVHNANGKIGFNSVPDSFRTVKTYYAFYESDHKGYENGRGDHYTSIMTTSMRWPVAINGNDSIDNLEQALLKQAFGTEMISLRNAVDRYLSNPVFNTPSAGSFHRLKNEPQPQKGFSYKVNTLIYPLMTSFRLLVMRVDRKTENGQYAITHTQFTHYDRMAQRVLSTSDILRSDKNQQLLSLINKKIELLKNEEGKDLSMLSASQVAGVIRCAPKGIFFEYPPGEIASREKGTISVFLSYKDLEDCMTQNFSALVEDNEGYWNYKPL